MDTPDSTTLKRCAKCGELKSRDQFCKDKQKKDGLQYKCKACDAAYRVENSERIAARHHKRYVKNRDKILAANRQRYMNNRDKANEYSRQYRKANHAVRLEYDRLYSAEHREQRRRWQQNNPTKIRAAYHRRQAKKRGLPNTFTTADWQQALDTFNGSCAVCGRPPGLWHTLAADHWIPLNSPDCPGTVPHNIVPLCHGVGGCNNSKANRSADEWLIENFRKHRGNTILKRIESFLRSRQIDAEGK
jgi:hypothetical protein